MTQPSATPTVRIKSANRVSATWKGGQRFETGRPGGPVSTIDGDAKAGQSPVDSVLSGLAACTSIDVLSILAKRRTPVQALTVDVVGERVDAVPSRLARVLLHFRIDGEGIDRVQAERAVELSVTKYCSVRDSLDPNIPVEWSIELNGRV